MSANSIAQAAVDPDLIKRVTALAQKDINTNAAHRDSQYGRSLQNGMAPTALVWSVAVDTEAAYDSALAAGRGAPGHDMDVITDAQISAAITAHWPADPVQPA